MNLGRRLPDRLDNAATLPVTTTRSRPAGTWLGEAACDGPPQFTPDSDSPTHIRPYKGDETLLRSPCIQIPPTRSTTHATFRREAIRSLSSYLCMLSMAFH